MTLSQGLATTFVSSLLVLSCGQGVFEPPVFDGQRAFGYLEKQVEFGPRVPGSEASASCRDYYYRHFSELGLEVDSQKFVFFDPYSQSDIPMVNVIASFKVTPDDKSPGMVLMAHYDSRPRTDFAENPQLRAQPIQGANDGASGVAVLMELANLFAQTPPEGNIDLVLVDGEDWGKAGDHHLYMIGSKEFAKRGIRDKYRFGIVVDMVGESDQQIYREGFSERYAKDLNDMVFSTARDLGLMTFIDSVRYPIMDDHLSLNIAGVPAIDIIDFDYPYWHTEYDTPDKCSAESLANVGRLLAYVVYNKSLWLKK
ncbi:MAG: M28 family peptidase [Candidatus Zixiibacteriota bacterium]